MLSAVANLMVLLGGNIHAGLCCARVDSFMLENRPRLPCGFVQVESQVIRFESFTVLSW